MLVREIMTDPVITVRPDVTVADAAAVLLDHEIAAAPVIDDDGRLVGIVSELDILRREVEPDPRGHERRLSTQELPPPRYVREVMTPEVIAVPAGVDVADVVAAMVDERVRSIPVVDAGRVVGIVSRRDVLRMLVRDDEAIRAEVARRVAETATAPHAIHVDSGVVTIGRSNDQSDDLVAALAARTVPGVVRVVMRPTATSGSATTSRDKAGSSL